MWIKWTQRLTTSLWQNHLDPSQSSWLMNMCKPFTRTANSIQYPSREQHKHPGKIMHHHHRNAFTLTRLGRKNRTLRVPRRGAGLCATKFDGTDTLRIMTYYNCRRIFPNNSYTVIGEEKQDMINNEESVCRSPSTPLSTIARATHTRECFIETSMELTNEEYKQI